MNRTFWLIGVPVLLFVIDRVSKWLVVHVVPASGYFVVPGVIGVVPQYNQGIAYSIHLPPVPLMFIIGALIFVLVFLQIRAYRRQELAAVFLYGLIIIGAWSNALDRLRFGQVIDLLVITRWPVFNLADVFITAGACGLAILLLRSRSEARR